MNLEVWSTRVPWVTDPWFPCEPDGETGWLRALCTQLTSPRPLPARVSGCRRSDPFSQMLHRHTDTVENVSGQRPRWLEDAMEMHPVDITSKSVK